MLTETVGDIWSYVATHRIVIPTNQFGVMGAGLALQAKQRYSGIQVAYQKALKTMPDKSSPWYSELYTDIILAPTKRHWKQFSSCADIRRVLSALSKIEGGPFAIPEMGCGLGGLEWSMVREYYNVFIPVKPEWVVVHPFVRS